MNKTVRKVVISISMLFTSSLLCALKTHVPLKASLNDIMKDYKETTKILAQNYSEDCKNQKNGTALADLTYKRFRDLSYPTLRYYESLKSIMSQLRKYKEKLEIRERQIKNNPKDDNLQKQFPEVTTYLKEINEFLEILKKFKSLIEKSDPYRKEYNEQNPPTPTLIIFNR